MTDSGTTQRLWALIQDDPRAALEEGLTPTDLQTLLLLVARARAAAVTPARVMRRWREDVFVRPTTLDARTISAFEAELWRRLPEQFVGFELSPVAPFGTCAAVAGVDQNRVLTTTRTSEVVADPTAVLAVDAARRRREGREESVHLATSHRVLRTQRFPPPFSQHFRLFALVSSARDTGSGRTEAELLLLHLRFYMSTLSALFPDDRILLRLAALSEGAAAERVWETVVPRLAPTPPNVEVLDDPGRQRGRGYYRDVAIRIDIVHDGVELEVGEGGFTDWTSRLIPDAKERCLTSCIATERLASAFAAPASEGSGGRPAI